jgi:hypothetical protein
MLRIQTADYLFHEGNPATGEKGTKVTDDFLNDVQEEICNVVEAAGIVLAADTRDQLLEAIKRFSGCAVTRTVSASGNVAATDSVLLADATAGPITLTLLSAAAVSARALTVIKVDASDNAVTIQAGAGQTLPTSEGRQQTADLTMQDESIRILPDGVSHWFRVG